MSDEMYADEFWYISEYSKKNQLFNSGARPSVDVINILLTLLIWTSHRHFYGSVDDPIFAPANIWIIPIFITV